MIELRHLDAGVCSCGCERTGIGVIENRVGRTSQRRGVVHDQDFAILKQGRITAMGTGAVACNGERPGGWVIEFRTIAPEDQDPAVREQGGGVGNSGHSHVAGRCERARGRIIEFGAGESRKSGCSARKQDSAVGEHAGGVLRPRRSHVVGRSECTQGLGQREGRPSQKQTRQGNAICKSRKFHCPAGLNTLTLLSPGSATYRSPVPSRARPHAPSCALVAGPSSPAYPMLPLHRRS